jgi:large subunit ribosomal protein L7/L12
MPDTMIADFNLESDCARAAVASPAASWAASAQLVPSGNFDVVLSSWGERKREVSKAVHKICGVSLVKAASSLPFQFLASKEEAEELRTTLTALGAEVTIKPEILIVPPDLPPETVAGVVDSPAVVAWRNLQAAEAAFNNAAEDGDEHNYDRLERAYHAAQEAFINAPDGTTYGALLKLRRIDTIERLDGHLEEHENLAWPRIIKNLIADLSSARETEMAAGRIQAPASPPTPPAETAPGGSASNSALDDLEEELFNIEQASGVAFEAAQTLHGDPKYHWLITRLSFCHSIIDDAVGRARQAGVDASHKRAMGEFVLATAGGRGKL